MFTQGWEGGVCQPCFWLPRLSRKNDMQERPRLSIQGTPSLEEHTVAPLIPPDTLVRAKLWGSQVWVPLSLSPPRKKRHVRSESSRVRPCIWPVTRYICLPAVFGGCGSIPSAPTAAWTWMLGSQAGDSEATAHKPFLRGRGFLGWTGCGQSRPGEWKVV